MRIIPVTLAIARATDIIRPALLTHRLPSSQPLAYINAQLYPASPCLCYCSATPRLFSTTQKLYSNSQQSMVFDVYLEFKM